MDREVPTDLAALVAAVNDGDDEAAGQLFEALYGELRAVARARLGAHGGAATLNPTALVHEAFLRLDGNLPDGLNDGRHFVAVVGRAMRRVVIDRARRRRALKRGADPLMTTLAPDQAADPGHDLSADELMALDAALDALESRDAEMARLVELKYFAGLTFPEVARALGVSERSAHRRWNAARAWLLTRLD